MCGWGGVPPQTVAVIMFYERKADANCTSVSAAYPNKANKSDQTLGEFSAVYRRSFRRAGASADEAEDYLNLSMKTSDDGAIFALGNISYRFEHQRSKQQLQKSLLSNISKTCPPCSQEYVPALIFWQKQFAYLFVPLTSLLNSVWLQCNPVNMEN